MIDGPDGIKVPIVRVETPTLDGDSESDLDFLTKMVFGVDQLVCDHFLNERQWPWRLRSIVACFIPADSF